jgi:hypothetical protein
MAEDLNRNPGDTPPRPPDPPPKPEAPEVGAEPNRRPEVPARQTPPDNASTDDAEVMKTSDTDFTRAMADADADYARAMKAADADLADSLRRPVEPTSDTEPAMPEHTLRPEPRTLPTEVEPEQVAAEPPAAEATATPPNVRGAALPAEQDLISGAAPPDQQDLIRESPQTPREFAISGARGAGDAMETVASNAEPIAVAADYALLAPGVPKGLQIDRDEFKANLEAAPREVAARLYGVADKLEQSEDPRDLGQGPLIRDGSPGMDVERELDPAPNLRPPEDDRSR